MLINALVEEKESKSRELMRVCGLEDWTARFPCAFHKRFKSSY